MSEIVVDPHQGGAPPGRDALRMFMRNKPAVFGLVLLIGIIAMAVLGPLFVDEPSLSRAGLASPREEGGGLMGTDENGRDIFAFVVHGGTATLQVSLVSVALIVLIGVSVGAIAGFYGGRVDSFLVWFTEIFQVLPALLFAMVIVALFSPTSLTVSVAIGLALWPQIARLTRAEFLRLKNLEYVKAAQAIGASDRRIMFRVILPNALPPLIVAASLVMGAAILFHAGLAFLGLSDPSEISWGRTIGTNRPNFPRVWWPVTFPGLAIFMTVLSFSLIGDGLQDAFNPKLRGR